MDRYKKEKNAVTLVFPWERGCRMEQLIIRGNILFTAQMNELQVFPRGYAVCRDGIRAKYVRGRKLFETRNSL